MGKVTRTVKNILRLEAKKSEEHLNLKSNFDILIKKSVKLLLKRI